MSVPLANRIDFLLDNSTYKHSVPVVVFSTCSLGFGIASTAALALRMLERKIKASTLAMIAGLYLQGVLGLFTLALFHAIDRTSEHIYTEALVYKIISALVSLVAGSMLLYNFIIANRKRNQVYVWLLYDLSNEQRVFLLLTCLSMSHISLTSLIFTELESDWAFDISLYWCVSTFLTIGFGDFVPKSDIGLIIFPIVTSMGVLLVGATIYAMRNVYLEALALRLASNYSRFTIVHDESISSLGDNISLSPPESNSISEALDIFHSESSAGRGSKWKKAVSDEISLPPSLLNGLSSSSKTDAEGPSCSTDGGHPPSRTHSFPTVADQHSKKKTLRITRSKRLPSVTILANNSLSETEIHKATREEILVQIYWAMLSVVVNVSLSSGLFAYLEGWSFLRGCYFIYCSFLTIGYGDYVLCNYISRSIFIWYIFFAIGSWTYLFSMVSELAFDEWSVETQSIAKRVERYEVKAKWKQMYSPVLKPSAAVDIDDLNETKGKGIDRGGSTDECVERLLHFRQPSSEPQEMNEKRPSDMLHPLAYSITISRSLEPSFLLRRAYYRQELELEKHSDDQDLETQPLLD